MSLERLPALPELAPRWRGGTIEFPLHHMRGGTSTGLVIWERYAPADRALREELLRHLMGLPLQGERRGNRQITGLGRGLPTSNKVFFADLEPDGAGGARLVSTLAQLAADKAAIDWSVNCGNMSAALPLWAIDTGLAGMHAPGLFEIEIRNTNTGVIAGSRMRLGVHGAAATAEIPGVDGAFPGVDLFLHHPAGAKTGRLLPTGREMRPGCRARCVLRRRCGADGDRPRRRLRQDRDRAAGRAGCRSGVQGGAARDLGGGRVADGVDELRRFKNDR